MNNVSANILSAHRRIAAYAVVALLALVAMATVFLYAPPVHGQQASTVWQATLTADQSGEAYFGCDNSDSTQADCSSSTVLTEDEFTHGGSTYAVDSVYWQSALNRLSFRVVRSGGASLTGQATRTALRSLTLNVDGTALAISDATAMQNDIYWSYDPATDWTDGRTVSLSLTALDVTFGSASVDARTYTAGTRVNKLVSGSDFPRLPEVTVNASADTLYWDESYSIAGLPSGLSMGSDRVIRGTPDAATSGAVTVTYTANVTTYRGTVQNVRDGVTGSASLTFEVTVNPAVTFSAEAQAFFNSNIIAYIPGTGWENATFPEATGGTGTLTYSLIHNSSGQPLADYVSSITFDASTRTVGGTVGTGERYAVTFIATDQNGAVAQGYTEVTHRAGGL